VSNDPSEMMLKTFVLLDIFVKIVKHFFSILWWTESSKE